MIENILVKDSFCSYCGTAFAEQKSYPRQCFHCGNDTYKNAVPIVVAIVPVVKPGGSVYDRSDPCRWLIQQRNIDPKKGGWALPGGYIDFGETWQEAAARELQEEMGLTTNPKDFYLLDVRNATNDNMLIFGVHSQIKEEDIGFQPNHEVSAMQLVTNPYEIDLCFPTHNEELRKYYDSLDW